MQRVSFKLYDCDENALENFSKVLEEYKNFEKVIHTMTNMLIKYPVEGRDKNLHFSNDIIKFILHDSDFRKILEQNKTLSGIIENLYNEIINEIKNLIIEWDVLIDNMKQIIDVSDLSVPINMMIQQKKLLEKIVKDNTLSKKSLNSNIYGCTENYLKCIESICASLTLGSRNTNTPDENNTMKNFLKETISPVIFKNFISIRNKIVKLRNNCSVSLIGNDFEYEECGFFPN